ncbi:hypothetical protein CHELA20_53637 [Hyphomicrobiales bacterium]|nr:hypothetical protein CHELA41_21291 [Hyphomicrobiales bacterium]CAH1684648.1 hypothetical protein CHELA20_53637 [Hyphomicrobiales bacterium]
MSPLSIVVYGSPHSDALPLAWGEPMKSQPTVAWHRVLCSKSGHDNDRRSGTTVLHYRHLGVLYRSGAQSGG